ncbi:MAG: VCBS repeat-containing protein [Putridiphycobacter sp.]|nr:VCBS repeat-containing protein [Putridiphycobacter sp.]
MNKKLYYFIALSILFLACNSESVKDKKAEEKVEIKNSMRFQKLTPEESGISFVNKVEQVDSMNFFNFEYIFNGGGVAVGDINNDGLTDIYFTGNQVSDKLYLNKGNLKFEDITASAIGDLASAGWHTGVNMVDVNADGYLDIYVARSGRKPEAPEQGNLLFINNKDNTFTERGAEFGVDIKKRTTHAAFFDFDNDNDLDLYVMNHPNQSETGEKKTIFEVNQMIKKGSKSSDIFLENVDGHFVDITKKAGLSNHSYGLGIAVADINKDGYEDLYISNDYMAPDYLYINNGDGTFSDQSLTQLKHMSNFSMGNDIADFNNDTYPDILTLDMASEDHVRSKKNMGGMSTERFWGAVNVGYHYQYMFNALHLNNGNNSFSEIGQLAGVSKTDWSWAPLFIDFDNDGFKDLFISNGYKRDSRDNDYMAKVNTPQGKQISYQEKLQLMPATKIQNYIYKNNGNLHFDKKMKEWEMDFAVNSNGAAFADFDKDGDMDLVINNMDELSFIIENKLEGDNNYLKIKLAGPEGNTVALGTKVTIKTKDGIQYQELQTARGYISSVENIMHFGLGKNKTVDAIEVEWLDGKRTYLENIAANQTFEIKHTEANNSPNKIKPEQNILFTDISNEKQKIAHGEIAVNDFEKEVLMPNKMSQLGPFMSTGDVNGDGLEDFYLSGSRYFTGQLMIQDESGKFTEKSGPWQKTKDREEMESLMFDADNDGDLDLYVVSGGNEVSINSEDLFDQLYINDGKGNFTNETDKRLPKMMTSGQSIACADINGDGYLDLFLGGRQTPGFYPFAPRSYLLLNREGTFKDITNNSPELMGPGLITASLFDDFDKDGDLDIVCVGEWMPITFFENQNNVFVNVTDKKGTSKEVGWWSSLAKGDFNNDGLTDYVAGNIGWNNKFHPTHDHPLEIYCDDFDQSGTYDIVLAKYQNNVCYPVRGRQCSSEQMPFIAQKFPNYSQFAEANLEKLYGEENLKKAQIHYSATNFSSSILLNKGNGTYTLKALPVEAQFSAINSIHIEDFNKDGNLDLLTVGNNYAAEVETIRYDAGRGNLMYGKGNGEFLAPSPYESGWIANNDDKDMVKITMNGLPVFLIASNNNYLRWIALK